MNVVFLDIDGVLNTHDNIVRQVNENGGEMKEEFQFNFCPTSLNNLKEIVESANAKIVISSTWRGSFKASYDSPLRKYYKAIQRNLASVGIYRRIYDIIPYLKGKGDVIRGEEIKAWLDKNPVDNFVIIDDDPDMGELMPHLAQCNLDGISDDVKTKALEILKEDNNG